MAPYFLLFFRLIGMAPMAHVLFSKVMNMDPKDSKWVNRDRFVLSNGHGCALQYSMLHLLGYQVSMDDLKKFRQLHSKTPGHPEANHTDGVEVTTGPLGQGICNGVGMALAQAHLAGVFNKPGFPIFSNHTFVFCGDGCLQEGVSAEASSLAGHWKLGNLIVLYDDNKITIDGETSLSFSEDVLKRYESYGWHTQTVYNGNTNFQALEDAIQQAKVSPLYSVSFSSSILCCVQSMTELLFFVILHLFCFCCIGTPIIGRGQSTFVYRRQDYHWFRCREAEHRSRTWFAAWQSGLGVRQGATGHGPHQVFPRRPLCLRHLSSYCCQRRCYAQQVERHVGYIHREVPQGSAGTGPADVWQPTRPGRSLAQV